MNENEPGLLKVPRDRGQTNLREQAPDNGIDIDGVISKFEHAVKELLSETNSETEERSTSMNENEPGLSRVTCKQAAKELQMDIESVQYLMRQGRLPIGYAMKKEKATKYSYYIYRGLLDAEKRRLAEGGERKW